MDGVQPVGRRAACGRSRGSEGGSRRWGVAGRAGATEPQATAEGGAGSAHLLGLPSPLSPALCPAGGRHGGADHLGAAHSHTVQGELPRGPPREPPGLGDNPLPLILSLRTPAAALASLSLEATTGPAAPWSCLTWYPEAPPRAGFSEAPRGRTVGGGPRWRPEGTWHRQLSQQAPRP